MMSDGQQWSSLWATKHTLLGYILSVAPSLRNANLGGTVVVGHTRARGSKDASHPLRYKEAGVRRDTCWGVETLILDARWKDDEEPEWGNCSGHCSSVCIGTARDPERVAHILEFATRCSSGLVCCNRGKHRSVSAAKILQLFFHRSIDYSYAARPHCYDCCQRPAELHVSGVCDSVRSLPRTAQPRLLLSYAFRLV